MTKTNTIRPGSLVSGPVLPEAIEVLAVVPLGSSLKIIGRGVRTGLARDTVVTAEQLAQLLVSAEREPFDGDARNHEKRLKLPVVRVPVVGDVE